MNLKDIFQYVLGILIVLCFFILLYYLVKKEVPEVNSNLLNLIVGALLGSFSTVVQYYYGSSKGSAEKDQLLRKKDE